MFVVIIIFVVDYYVSAYEYEYEYEYKYEYAFAVAVAVAVAIAIIVPYRVIDSVRFGFTDPSLVAVNVIN